MTLLMVDTRDAWEHALGSKEVFAKHERVIDPIIGRSAY